MEFNKLKNFWIQVIALLTVLFLAMYLTFNQTVLFPVSDNGEGQTGQVDSEVKRLEIVDTISNPPSVKTSINVEIADTAEKKSKGLGGRETLAQDAGMLFVFEKIDKYVFWMKGMKVPLDFIYINDDRIVDLLTDVKPPEVDTPDNKLDRYAPIIAVNKVLEVNSGFVKSHGVGIGDKIVLIEN